MDEKCVFVILLKTGAELEITCDRVTCDWLIITIGPDNIEYVEEL